VIIVNINKREFIAVEWVNLEVESSGMLLWVIGRSVPDAAKDRPAAKGNWSFETSGSTHHKSHLIQLACDNLQSRNTEAVSVWKCMTDLFRLINGEGQGGGWVKEIGKGNWKPWSVKYFLSTSPITPTFCTSFIIFIHFLIVQVLFATRERSNSCWVSNKISLPVRSLSPRNFRLNYGTDNDETKLMKWITLHRILGKLYAVKHNVSHEVYLMTI